MGSTDRIHRQLRKHFENDPQVLVKSVEQGRRSAHYKIKIDVQITATKQERFIIVQGSTPSSNITLEQGVSRNLRQMLRQRLGE